MYYTQAQKRATYKWRDNNKEEYNEYMLKLNMKYYFKNQEERKKKRMEQYYYNKENNFEEVWKTFRKMKI
jgi:hypothetical protein